MNAKFTKKECSNAKNLADKKEVVTRWELIGFKKGEFHSLVTFRSYMGRSSQASTVYSSIWVHCREKQIYVSGRGDAGGYGYHKESQAMEGAIHSAGIELYGPPYKGQDEPDKKRRAYIGGCGDGSMEAAILAIGEALGFKKLYIAKG